MGLVRKSIVSKVFFRLFALAILILAGVYLYYHFYLKTDFVPMYVFYGAFGVFLLIITISYWFDIAKPFKVVLTQMQALLTGKMFRKIYTDRVDEIGVIAYFFNKVTEGFGQMKTQISNEKRMEEELTIASELQRDIFPSKNPFIPGFQVEAKYRSASELGGDSFNFISAKDKFYIYVGDVTGHGAVASLMMAIVNTLIVVFSDTYSSAYEVLVNTNKYIKRWVKKAMYMTLVMLSWDLKTQKLSYVGAGHEHILVYHAKTGECEAVLTGGIALGMVPDNSKIIKEKDIPLEDGDCVVLYTDGLTEAKNKKGDMFGLDNLKQSLIEHAMNYSAEGVNYHMARDVSTFVGEAEQSDDMTLIVLKRDSSNIDSTKVEIKDVTWKA